MRYLKDSHIDDLRELLSDIRAKTVNAAQTAERMSNIISGIDSYQHHTPNPEAHPEVTNLTGTPEPTPVEMEKHW